MVSRALVIAVLLAAGACAASAAEVAPFAAGIAAALADSGSSDRDTRRRAVEAIPLERMGPAERQVAEQALRGTTLYRRLPVETITCDPALLQFVLTKPETLVDVWRVLGISRLSLDPAGGERWRLSDGYGTVGLVRRLYAHHDATGGLVVFHGRGAYTGPLAPRHLTGSCLVVIRHAPAADAAGRGRQAVQLDAFLDVDGIGLEIVTRSLQPLIVRSAASNLHEIGLFVSQFAAAARRNPAAVARIAERMPRTQPEDRRRLVALAAGGDTVVSPVADDAVRAELTARWLPVAELDAARR